MVADGDGTRDRPEHLLGRCGSTVRHHAEGAGQLRLEGQGTDFEGPGTTWSCLRLRQAWRRWSRIGSRTAARAAACRCRSAETGVHRWPCRRNRKEAGSPHVPMPGRAHRKKQWTQQLSLRSHGDRKRHLHGWCPQRRAMRLCTIYAARSSGRQRVALCAGWRRTSSRRYQGAGQNSREIKTPSGHDQRVLSRPKAFHSVTSSTQLVLHWANAALCSEQAGQIRWVAIGPGLRSGSRSVTSPSRRRS